MNNKKYIANLTWLPLAIGTFIISVVLWFLGERDEFLLFKPTSDYYYLCSIRILAVTSLTISFYLFFIEIRRWTFNNWISIKKPQNAEKSDENSIFNTISKKAIEKHISDTIAQTVKHTRNLYFIHVFILAYGLATLYGIQDSAFYSINKQLVELPFLKIEVDITACFFIMPLLIIFFSLYLQIYLGYLTMLLDKYSRRLPGIDKDKPYPWIGVFVVRQRGTYQIFLILVFGFVSWWAAPFLVFKYWYDLLFLRSTMDGWLYHHDIIASQAIGLIALVFLAIIMIYIGIRIEIRHQINRTNPPFVLCSLAVWRKISPVLFFIAAIMVIFQWDFFRVIHWTIPPADLAHSCLSLPADSKSQKGVAGAKLPNINLMRADLRGAFLQSADLSGAILEEANLSNANLIDAQLKRAELMGADLWGAHMEGAQLQSAHLEGANLWEAKLDAACLGVDESLLFNENGESQIEYLPEGCGIVPCGDLPVTHLDGAQLGQASLHRATIGCASFRAANLYQTKISENRFVIFHYDMHFSKYTCEQPPSFEYAYYVPPTSNERIPSYIQNLPSERVKHWILTDNPTEDYTYWTIIFDLNERVVATQNAQRLSDLYILNGHRFSVPLTRNQENYKSNKMKWLNKFRPTKVKELLKNDPERFKRLKDMKREWLNFDYIQE